MYQTNDYHRINGWVLAPAAYLIMTFLSASVMLALYIMTFFSQNNMLSAGNNHFTLMWFLSVAITAVMWCFTLWVLKLLFIRSKKISPHFYYLAYCYRINCIENFRFLPYSRSNGFACISMATIGSRYFCPLH